MYREQKNNSAVNLNARAHVYVCVYMIVSFYLFNIKILFNIIMT